MPAGWGRTPGVSQIILLQQKAGVDSKAAGLKVTPWAPVACWGLEHRTPSDNSTFLGDGEQVGHSLFFSTERPGQVEREVQALWESTDGCGGVFLVRQKLGALLVSIQLHNGLKMDMSHRCHRQRNTHT